MKKLIYYAVVGLCCYMLSSCGSSSKLAEQIAGAWDGAPEKFDDQGGLQGTAVRTLEFGLTPGQPPTNGGSLKISSLMSVMMQVVGNDGLIEPISLSASATSQISGTWKPVDDDEIAVNLDINTLVVKVDPSAVVISDNVISGQNIPELDSLRYQAVANVEAQIRSVLTLKYSSVRDIEDVEIKDGKTMKCEISDQKLMFTKQQ